MSTTTIDDKTFADLRALAALQGLTLTRSNPADVPVLFYVERFGLVRQQSAQDLIEMMKETSHV